MLTNYPLVSVIVPAYNVEKYVKKTIESVLNQSYPNIELIVIDDCSTDNTLSILKNMLFIHENVHLIINRYNQGLSGSRNIGIRAAQGDYVEFLDGDDRLKQDAVTVLVKQAQKHDADLVAFNYEVIRKEGELKPAEKRMIISNFPTGVFLGQDKLNLLFKNHFPHFAWSFLYKKSLFADHTILYPVGRSYEDYATTYKTVFFANKLVSLNKQLYEYVQRDSSIMHLPKVSQAEDILMATKEIDVFFQSSSSEIKNWVYAYQIPRLLNAYGISLKAGSANFQLTKKIKHLILKKVSTVSVSSFNTRDRIKILLIKLNLLVLLYKLKRMRA
ncbi:glycosyltransferase family 2 protein [Oenococcus alcoholitolerans]|uniref:glycosyltransferase family 2 protein n=1 Tax=Oenococcus alcoholitolerans TaxID=931074 RepID=UPI003F6FAF05